MSKNADRRENGSGPRFQRRDLLKALGAVPAALVTFQSAAAQQAGSEPIPVAQPAPNVAAPITYQTKVLTEHEFKTIRVLGDRLIPADERSGSASDASVPEFIDDWLDFQRGDLLHSIRGGLTWLDLQCNRTFGKGFVDCALEQQRTMLDRIAYPERAAAADAEGVAFFNSLRDLVASGFFTSEIGLKDLPYLGNEPSAVWSGCPAPVLAKLGLGK